MNKITLLLIVLSFTNTAQALQSVEEWECKDYYGNWNNILVKTTIHKERSTGTIQAAGITQKAEFHVRGLNRRWNFGLSNDQSYTYNFAFIIKPNGDANYYDFSLKKETKPSIYMKCRQTK